MEWSVGSGVPWTARLQDWPESMAQRQRNAGCHGYGGCRARQTWIRPASRAPKLIEIEGRELQLLNPDGLRKIGHALLPN